MPPFGLARARQRDVALLSTQAREGARFAWKRAGMGIFTVLVPNSLLEIGSFVRGTAFMECPESASPDCDVRRFDDRCPTSNLAFYQCCEWLLASTGRPANPGRKSTPGTLARGNIRSCMPCVSIDCELRSIDTHGPGCRSDAASAGHPRSLAVYEGV